MTDQTKISGPWTRHGHAVAGVTVLGLNRPALARCGGPAICSQCALDAERIRATHDRTEPERTEPDATPVHAPRAFDLLAQLLDEIGEDIRTAKRIEIEPVAGGLLITVDVVTGDRPAPDQPRPTEQHRVVTVQQQEVVDLVAALRGRVEAAKASRAAKARREQ